MKLYHSTSIKNAKNIIREGKINPYTYFSEILKISKQYGSFYGRYKTFVVDVNPDDISNWAKGDYWVNTSEIKDFEIYKQK